jgi:hypothetical protein
MGQPVSCRATSLALVGLLWLGAQAMPARAADWYTGAKPQTPGDDWIVSVDASTDVTSQGSYFGDVVATGAPAGTLAESGLRVRADGLAGIYSYTSTSTGQTVRGTQEGGAALVGYAWVTPNASFAAYLGGDVRNNTLSPLDSSNPVVGTSFGAKGQFEAYGHPTASTIIAAQASYATNKTAYFARLRTGYLIGNGLYIGPEFVALGDAFFNQERVGASLVGLRMGALQFGFSGGYLYDRVRKSGAYASIDARVGF